ncbi:MAG: cytidylate kinase-like family protein [Clostridiales bacterium]|nr:cytidylate kinase-like family protein [Clostridiales bacterium]
MSNYVITIARTCGSGGSYVGEELKKKLGINLYEQDILQIASEDSGISMELFARSDEELKKNPLFRFSKYIYRGDLIPPSSSEFTSEENLFNYQAKVLKELAEKESYIVIGRCADFVLDGTTNLIRVFICADKDDRINTEAERLQVSAREAKERIEKVDKKRNEHYKYFTGNDRENMANYDICLNTSVLPYEKCADAIIDYMKLRLE